MENFWPWRPFPEKSGSSWEAKEMVRAGQRRHDAGNEQCQGRVKIDRPAAREPDRKNRHRQRQEHVLEDVEQAVRFSKSVVEPAGGNSKLAQQNARLLEYALAPAGLDIGNAQQDLAAAKFDVKLALAMIRRREQKLHADVFQLGQGMRIGDLPALRSFQFRALPGADRPRPDLSRGGGESRLEVDERFYKGL